MDVDSNYTESVVLVRSAADGALHTARTVCPIATHDQMLPQVTHCNLPEM